MDLLTIITILFMVLESLNVFALYNKPDLQYANAVGCFKAYENSQDESSLRDFVKYLINWVAGTKVIFIALLTVILIFGNEETQAAAMIALIVSILTFYWKLYPLIKKMDKKGQISPKGYSKTLAGTISIFVTLLFVAFLSRIV